MVLTPVTCPHCGSEEVKKNGTSRNGKQRLLCTNEKCRYKTFVEYDTYNAYEPNIRSRYIFFDSHWEQDAGKGKNPRNSPGYRYR